MTYEEYNHFCRNLAATSHVVQWGNSDVWKVGGKVFAIARWEQESGSAITFKTSPLNFDVLKDQPRFKPAPYLAARGFKWIQQHAILDSDKEALKYYLTESHRIVSLGLTKKRQKELNLNQGS